MHDYLSDKEQIELFKKWWNDYGKIIALAILVGLGIGFGWRYWQNKHQQHILQASLLYGQMQQALGNQQINQADSLTNVLVKSYANTPYAAQAVFWRVQKNLQEQKYVNAIEQLEWIKRHTNDKYLQDVALLRKSRILLDQNQPQKALTALSDVQDSAFSPLVNLVRGEAYFALGNTKASDTAYQLADEALKKSKINTSIVTLK